MENYVLNEEEGITDEGAVSFQRTIKQPFNHHTINSMLPLFIQLYNAGYSAGHNDTVDGYYTDILPIDADKYHKDIVIDLVSDLLHSND